VSRPSPHRRFCLTPCPLLSLPRSTERPPAATSPPPCTARLRAPKLFLSHASKLGGPPPSFPFVHLPIPQPQTPEHHRHHPQNAGVLSPPSTPLSKVTPPALTPPLAPLEPRAAHWPLLVAYPPPEPPRRRAPPFFSAADPPARIAPPLQLTPTSIPATSRCARTW